MKYLFKNKEISQITIEGIFEFIDYIKNEMLSNYCDNQDSQFIIDMNCILNNIYIIPD